MSDPSSEAEVPVQGSQEQPPPQATVATDQIQLNPDEDDGVRAPSCFVRGRLNHVLMALVVQVPDEIDSALGDELSSYSASLRSSVLEYRYENGRRYHNSQGDSYMAPNDEAEQRRLDLVHHIYRLMLDGALYVSPIPDSVHQILDVGTGTGICKF
jgi:hypothetical protein